MSEMLAPERIAEIVEAAKDGQLPEPVAQAARRGGRVRTVDFSRPTKFGADQVRRIVRSIEIYCQTATTRLSSELRWPLEFEILNTTQLTWSATQGQVPSGSLQAVLEVEPIGTRMLLTVEQPFVLVALECLLGGAPERPAGGRRLSEIDWSLARALIESLVQPLSLVWQELGGVTLSVGEIGLYDTVQVASVSEPTLSTLFEARINQQSYSLGLLVPWAAIEPVEDVVAGREAPETADAGARGEPMRSPMARVPVTVRAEVAFAELSVAEILALQPGSVIGFDRPAEDGVELLAGNVRIAQGRPGRQGPQRAVQLTAFTEETR